MKIILTISLILNLVAITKWFLWSRGFIGAFYLYQLKYGELKENELKLLMKKAIDCGIRNTFYDFRNKY